MNFYKFSFFFIASIGSAFSQSKVVDSLTQTLSGADGQEKIDILNRLTYELISKDNVRAMSYCDQALTLSNKLHYEKGAGLAFTYKGVFEYLSGEFSDGRSNLFHGLALSTKASDRQNRGYTLLQLGNSYMNQSLFDSSLTFYNKSYEILKDSADPVNLSKLYKNLSTLYGILTQYDLQRKYLLRALRIRELLHDQALIANALIALVDLTIREGNFEETNAVFNRVEKILQANPKDLGNLNDWRYRKALYLLKERKFDEALVLIDSARNYYVRNALSMKFVTLQTNLGKIFYERGEYEVALKSLYEALRVAELKKYDVQIMDIQMQLGWVNYHLGELSQSLLFANLALTLANSHQMPDRVANALTLKGVVFTRLKDFSNAKKSLDQVLLIRENLKDNARISEVLMNLGFLEESRGNYTAAQTHYKKSVALAESSKYDFGKAWSLLGLSTIAYKQGDYRQATALVGRAERFARQINANEIIIRVYELNCDLMAAENRYKESLRYSLLASNLKDSLHRSDLSRRFVNLQKMEEIERRDRDINALTKDKQLADDKINLQDLKLNQQKILIAASAIGLTLVGVLAFVYARYYARVKRLNASIWEKTKRIQTQANKLTEVNNQLIEQNKLIENQTTQLVMANETLEDEVSQRTEELTKQNLQLEQFAYMTSHNLRAPVARLLGLTQLFDPTNPSDPLNITLIEKVRTTAQEFDVTMGDLTAILEVKKGVNENFSVLDIEACFRKAKATLAGELSPIPFSLSARFDEKIVYGVESYLISIFYNLLSNSTKFKKDGTLRVHVVARKEHGHIIVEYQDDGIGFDVAGAGENLFKPYKRFHLQNTGKGLGLYMIKLQVEAMGGTVVVQSAPGHGFSSIISFKALSEEQLKVETDLNSALERQKNQVF